ncbi:hypothetical protein N7447_000355 [Penicillium robsamsonii]|uniref:uncharacterized protein n=1 Tax=Penicillium robsamsonii TaxID=1792511 RepID=UPI0025494BA0|nr:uncharacterized protein N7447_000355 [Penicillium robsamsonii]KAJ5834329.1 hypothetical protein N7447_000355 [Penicillium robsamsonii]
MVTTHIITSRQPVSSHGKRTSPQEETELVPGPVIYTSVPLAVPPPLPETQPAVSPDQNTPSLTDDSTATSSSPPTPTRSQEILLGMDSHRNILDLYFTEYEPVWAAGVEFPGVIPEEIAEFLYEGIEQVTLFIGPVSSLLCLAGVEELIELIEDPAYTLTDEYRSIPQGAPRRWIVQMLYEEGMIPTTIMAKVCGENVEKQTSTVTRASLIPPNVTSTSARKSVPDVFPFALQQSFLPTVSCVEAGLKKKNTNRNCVDLMNNFINSLGGNLLFKGLSRRAVANLVAFFTPLVSSNTFDHEFGPATLPSYSNMTKVLWVLILTQSWSLSGRWGFTREELSPPSAATAARSWLLSPEGWSQFVSAAPSPHRVASRSAPGGHSGCA